MRIRILAAAGLTLALAGCSSLLDVNPPTKLPQDQAITNAEGARAALAGAYDGLQSLSYYGGDYLFFNDLYADNAIFNGTSNSFADADARALFADNGVISATWAAIYAAINRDNNILQKVPALANMDSTEKAQIVGEAYLLRALSYHNLVRVYGDVPMPLVPASNISDASKIARTPKATVYAQIITDLTQAERLISATSPTTHATAGAAKALLARVYLYMGDYANAKAKADEVIALGYGLAPNFSDLFDAQGIDTPEDIFKLAFSATDFTNIGYYYISGANGGAGEVAVENDLIAHFDVANDLRFAWSIDTLTSPAEGTKWKTTAGAEDFHVIRFAEVLLIKAEAEAQLNNLAPAVGAVNLIRVRAGLTPDTLGIQLNTQQDVLNEIALQRRLELAFEGDRFPDLVRTGQAQAVLAIPAFRELFPIPQSEIDVAPNIVQNPGY
jgi:hypothetical protein